MTAAPTLTDRNWRLSPSVSLRPEPFGALAYDFHTRQLSFLKTPQLAAVVEGLGTAGTVGDALARAGVDPAHHDAYLIALRSLAGQGILQETTA